jgi:hypothetical protein
MSNTISINARRPLPSTPGSPSKAQNDNKNISTPPEPAGLALVVLKELPNSSRPRLPGNVQEPPGAVEPGTAALKNQSSPPKHAPPPIPRRAVVPTSDHTTPDQLLLKYSNSDLERVDLSIETQPEAPIGPPPRTKVERRLTSPSKRPALKAAVKPSRIESNEQKTVSPHSLETYSFSPRIPSPLEEDRATNYGKELNKLATDLGISLRPKLERTRHVRQLSAAYPPRREVVISDATVQSDPSDAGSGSENSDIKNN